MSRVSPCWIEISKPALVHNLLQVRRLLSPDVRILAVVKADAYGHGAVPAALAFQQAGAEFLGVASLDEGLELREAGIAGPVLVLGCSLATEAPYLVEHHLTPTICDIEFARELNRAALAAGTMVRAHLKVDTGMGRIGVRPDDAYKFMQEIKAMRGLSLEGIYTHFPSADEKDLDYTLVQVRTLRQLVQGLARLGFEIPMVHAANSAALSEVQESHFGMVRAGLALYGVRPAPHTFANSDLRPALCLKARVAFVKKVPAGTPVSYGRTYTTQKATTLATLSCGYRHGLSWQLSNRGQVLVRGMKAPIAGRVCMDQTVLDVGHIPHVSPGDEVTVYGTERRSGVTVEDVATSIGTIPYEVLCHLDKRIPRIYL